MKNFIAALFVSFFALTIHAQIENKCLSFGYNTKGIVLQELPQLNTSNSYSIELWLNIESWKKRSVVFRKKTRKSTISLTLGNENEFIVDFGINKNKSTSYTNIELQKNKWIHIAVVYNKETKKQALYINKKLQTNTETTSKNQLKVNTNSSFVIGTNGFQGRIDELRVWNYALAVNNIVMNNTVADFQKAYCNLIAYWKFEHKSNNIIELISKKESPLSKGVSKEIYTDNTAFNYKIITGYAPLTPDGFYTNDDFDYYKRINDLILFFVRPTKNGSLVFRNSDNNGVLNNVEFIKEFKKQTWCIRL